MSNFYFSQKNNGFYAAARRQQYESSPAGWPADAVPVSDDEYKTLFEGQSKGKRISADSNGRPILSIPVIDWHARAESERQTLLTEANITTADWRTELQLDVITDEDKASLILWMAYIKAVKALDFSHISDQIGYEGLIWPEKP